MRAHVWPGALVAVGLVWAGAAAKVPTPGVEQLVAAAEVIVIGRVTEIVTVPGVPTGRSTASRLAVVEVEETLKGPVAQRWVYLANKRGFCDLTGAVAGERAVLFLEKVPRWGGLEIDAALVAAGEPLAIERLHAIAYSGRGRWPIRLFDGIEHALLRDVFLPQDVPAFAGEDPKAPGVQYASLAVLRELVGPQATWRHEQQPTVP